MNTQRRRGTRLLGAGRRAGAGRRPAALARSRARARAQQPGAGGRRPVAAARSRRRACRGRAASGEPDHRAHGGAADRGSRCARSSSIPSVRTTGACGSSRPIACRSSVRRRTWMPRCAARSASAPISQRAQTRDPDQRHRRCALSQEPDAPGSARAGELSWRRRRRHARCIRDGGFPGTIVGSGEH